MEKKRTFEKAVDDMVDWWVEKSFKTQMNQDIGTNISEDRGLMMLMNFENDKVKKKLTEEQINKFKTKLKELLIKDENSEFKQFDLSLDVDYHPSTKLKEACDFAEIDYNLLPMKTTTYINNDLEIEGKYQYRGDWFKL